MFVLQLHHLKTEADALTVVARAEKAEDLIQLMGNEKVEPYQADDVTKYFRTGGPLEWFDIPRGEVHSNGMEYLQDVGDLEKWIEIARKDWDEKIMVLPDAAELLKPKVIDLSEDQATSPMDNGFNRLS